jgi:hypothetical protein
VEWIACSEEWNKDNGTAACCLVVERILCSSVEKCEVWNTDNDTTACFVVVDYDEVWKRYHDDTACG